MVIRKRTQLYTITVEEPYKNTIVRNDPQSCSAQSTMAWNCNYNHDSELRGHVAYKSKYVGSWPGGTQENLKLCAHLEKKLCLGRGEQTLFEGQ